MIETAVVRHELIVHGVCIWWILAEWGHWNLRVLKLWLLRCLLMIWIHRLTNLLWYLLKLVLWCLTMHIMSIIHLIVLVVLIHFETRNLLRRKLSVKKMWNLVKILIILVQIMFLSTNLFLNKLNLNEYLKVWFLFQKRSF